MFLLQAKKVLVFCCFIANYTTLSIRSEDLLEWVLKKEVNVEE